MTPTTCPAYSNFTSRAYKVDSATCRSAVERFTRQPKKLCKSPFEVGSPTMCSTGNPASTGRRVAPALILET